MFRTWRPFLAGHAAIAACLWSFDVQAYIGPGAGLSAIGSLLALVAAIVVGLLGFIWFPIKRILRQKGARARNAGTRSAEPDVAGEGVEQDGDSSR